MKLALFLPLVFLFIIENALAAPFVGSDHRLQFMQKMQGSWMRDCRKTVNGGEVFYEQTRLTVSYTHLKFKTGEFKDSNCTYVSKKYETLYPYVLGDLADPVKGKRVYQIDIGVNQAEPGVIRMYPKNIVQFNNGYLYFGLRNATISFKPQVEKQRLSSLNRQAPFYRP